MKKIALVVALLGVVALVGQAWAGSSCCPSSKAKKSVEKEKSACVSALSGIELTADQQEKIAKIEKDCKAKGSTVEACSDSMSKIREVLNDDQKAVFDAASAKSSGKSGCGS
ncbi:MAG TPA: hypothetical protein PJ991_00775 [Kiritimatiellia bacterium]|nr:hypothetical protein [Kiritimatiellia bacterium]